MQDRYYPYPKLYIKPTPFPNQLWYHVLTFTQVDIPGSKTLHHPFITYCLISLVQTGFIPAHLLTV